MELEKLQQKEKLEEYYFRKEIKKDLEDFFISEYKKFTLTIDELTETFSIDLKMFKGLLLQNSDKQFCKFYYTQKGHILNLSLSFSDNTECEILDSEKALYEIDHNLFIETNPASLRKMTEDYHKGIGTTLSSHTGTNEVLVYYTLSEINRFITHMEDQHPSVFSLKFTMIQYNPTKLRGDLLIPYLDRINRISFSVRSLFLKSNKEIGESAGYNLGNLMP